MRNGNLLRDLIALETEMLNECIRSVDMHEPELKDEIQETSMALFELVKQRYKDKEDINHKLKDTILICVCSLTLRFYINQWIHQEGEASK